MTAWFTQRLRASGLSPWELGDLLGIHPHQLAHINTAGLSTQRPIAVLIELSRQLDMHPADLIADLDGVLTNRRLPDNRRYGDDHGDDRRAEQLDGEADTLVLLAALAHARTPLSVDDLARTLGWALERVEAALGHAHHHPGLAGPMTLRRVPPETFTLTPRLDVLTAGPQHAIQVLSAELLSAGWRTCCHRAADCSDSAGPGLWGRTRGRTQGEVGGIPDGDQAASRSL